MENIQQYITDSNKLGRLEADSLDSLREKHPYFQALHILIAKCHKNQNTFGFNKNLKLASLYAGDRKVLYNFINSEENPENVIAQSEEIASLPEKKPVFEIINKLVVPAKEVIEDLKVNSYSEIQVKMTNDEVSPQNEKESSDGQISQELEQLQLESTTVNTFTESKEIINKETLEIKEIVLDETKESNSLADNISEKLKEVEATPKEEVETISEAKDLEDNIDLSEEPKILTDDKFESSEQDFFKWLDNFALEDTNKISEDKAKKDADLNDNNQNIINGEPSDNKVVSIENKTEYDSEAQLEYSLPINFEEESDDETGYNPAAWAEIAYEIQAFVKTPEVPEENIFTPKKVSKDEIDDLLDRFIKKNPSISRPKAEFYKPENMARKSEEFHAEVVSESLAQLFYKQGLLHKSLEIYEKLMLQNPDKKDIFAARIKSIKDELINQL